MQPRILIAIPTRRDIFAQTFVSVFSLGATPSVSMTVHLPMGSVIQDKRNQAVERALKGAYTHLLFIDNDVAFPADTLTKLLAVNKDVVGAITYKSYGDYGPNILMPGKKHLEAPKTWPDEPFKVAAAATGVMLIKTEMLEKMAKPLKREWFKFDRIKGIRYAEDTYFCHQVIEHGGEVWVDPTIPTAHYDNYGFGQHNYNASKE